MAEDVPITVWRNISVAKPGDPSSGAHVGRGSHHKHIEEAADRDESWVAPFSVGGQTRYIGPGEDYRDASGQMAGKLGGHHFVECRDPAEAERLKVPQSALVFGKAGGRYAGKLLGFIGLHYVLKDITRENDKAIATTGNRVASMERLAELEKDRQRLREENELMTDQIKTRAAQKIELDATIATMKKQKSSDDAEIEALKSKVKELESKRK